MHSHTAILRRQHEQATAEIGRPRVNPIALVDGLNRGPLRTAVKIDSLRRVLLGPVTLFELLAAAAVAGIIATDFWLCANIWSRSRVVVMIAIRSVDVVFRLLGIGFGHRRCPKLM